MGDTYLEVGRNVNRAWPKLTTSMVEAYHEHDRNPIQHGRKIRTVTTYLENYQIMPRIRLKHTASIVKTCHEHSENIPRARS